MNLANAFAFSRQRYFALKAIAAVTTLADFPTVPSSGRTSSQMVSQIENDHGASPTNSGEPRAIFLFRFVSDPDGNEAPTVFQFKWMQTISYLLAQRFGLRDKGLLYIGNFKVRQPTKLVLIVSQLFFPLVTLEGVINWPN